MTNRMSVLLERVEKLNKGINACAILVAEYRRDAAQHCKSSDDRNYYAKMIQSSLDSVVMFSTTLADTVEELSRLSVEEHMIP